MLVRITGINRTKFSLISIHQLMTHQHIIYLFNMKFWSKSFQSQQYLWQPDQWATVQPQHRSFQEFSGWKLYFWYLCLHSHLPLKIQIYVRYTIVHTICRGDDDVARSRNSNMPKVGSNQGPSLYFWSKDSMFKGMLVSKQILISHYRSQAKS